MGSDDIRRAIEALLRERGSFSSSDLSDRTGRSRQALQQHLRRAMDEGWLTRTGRARATSYHRRGPEPFDRVFATSGLAEDTVWTDLDRWLTEGTPVPTENARSILRYVVTELVNNAIDHSGSPSVRVRSELDHERCRVIVADEGVGALENLRSHLGLEDHLHALQELSKGKVTTQPEHHSGEGIFFSSKAVDRFELAANGLEWLVDNTRHDQSVRETTPRPGTSVRIELSPGTTRSLQQVFAEHTHDFEFDTTRCVIRLFEHGTRFVSRSEAKRLVAGLERFREVILDFHGVEGVGQGFVDEVFRVWANGHPGVKLVPRAMSPAVEFMVRRGLGTR